MKSLNYKKLNKRGLQYIKHTKMVEIHQLGRITYAITNKRDRKYKDKLSLFLYNRGLERNIRNYIDKRLYEL